MQILEGLRQYLFPREFRIAAVPWPTGMEDLLAKLEETLRTPLETGSSGNEERFLADVATGIWRLRQKMVEPGTGQPLEGMRKLFRHVEAVWDALEQAGVKIVDLTGRPFDPGLSLKVVAFQPTPGINRERIIETIKPTVYLRDQSIQMGEVIVGRPQESEHT